jgi:hypothetical protein
MARSYPSRERALERKKSSTAQAIYATIRVNRLKFTVAQRLHTNRTNNDVAFIASDHPSETADYTDVNPVCQGGNTDYWIHLNKYQTPNPAPASSAITTRLKSTMTSLNLRYRFLSGGANELCGKYGGGVYVAIS